MAVLGPLVVLGGLEVGMRVIGVAQPGGFLLPVVQGDRSVWIPNPHFTDRFFGPERARRADEVPVPRPKAEGTFRIFVLGESAAFGDPVPDFGLARMLRALLELRYPDARFEVVNAAITGINSHAVLPIAESCADADGDFWVVYMGNNEVVGPFGAGTVFGPQAPPLPLIRASLAVKATRLGQGLDAWVRRLQPLPADKGEWGGMLMFVENRVPARDPRMPSVYSHFEHNLGDMLDVARRRGIPVVLSTVAVNLQECAPFASAYRDGLSEAQQSQWQDFFERGAEAMGESAPSEALAFLRQAAGVDGSVAELHYQIGHTLLALGQPEQAYEAFAQARDLDTLRFRCDSRLNQITRRLAASRTGDGVAFVDAERVFADLNRRGASDGDLFYDHVHLTFLGTYQLAAQVAQEVSTRLPAAVRGAGAAEWATMGACAERLAWTAHGESEAIGQMTARYQDAPFTFQSDHEFRLRGFHARLKELSGQQALAGPRHAADACRNALKRVPDDVVLLRRLAKILHALKDLEEAEAAARQVVEALPHSKAAWMRLGRILTDRGNPEEALHALDRARSLNPGDDLVSFFQAAAWVRADRMEEAEAALERAIDANPRLGSAYLALAGLQAASGRTEEADANVRLALANPVMVAEDLAMLAVACQQRAWYPEALTNLVMAIKLDPANPAYLLQAGNILDAMGSAEQARQYYQQAVAVAPRMGEAHFSLGLSYGRAGDAEGAHRHFQEAVKRLPDLPEAHLNLAFAQANTGRKEEAIRSLHEVLRVQPEHPRALEWLRALETAP